ncbi:I78 family peptidase inhibitor [Aliiroseovarius sp. 2305UL8-7]|uniref:I78 family peptidase inhibitor n=1 Tax=Aliiroseovarius conchicola TaxID=3121637 RepID=UPI0035274802
MKLHVILPVIILLWACQAGSPPPTQDDLTPRCGKDRLLGLVGQDAAILREVELPATTRVVQPGMALTQDYRPDRLNVSIDDDGKIDRVWCS